MKFSHNYPLPTTTPLFYVGDNEAQAYVRWSALAGATVGQSGTIYTILEPGTRNGGPGPDFLRAKIRFPDGSIRTGDVEIHCSITGWRQHDHRWDRRYSSVILHVVTGGLLTPIKLGAERRIPTIVLPRLLQESMPCESNCTTHPGQATIDQMISLLAAQRWCRRLTRFTGANQARQQLELALRLARGGAAAQILHVWREQLQSGRDMVGFIAAVLDRALGQMGLGNKLAGRLVAGSALIWHHQYAAERLWTLTFSDTWAMLRDFTGADLPVPSKQFVIELVGNWLLPLSHIATDRDRYDEWYNLPRGWVYGRVRTFTSKIDRSTPKLFGEQQGLLEWQESMCAINACLACPLVNSQL